MITERSVREKKECFSPYGFSARALTEARDGIKLPEIGGSPAVRGSLRLGIRLHMAGRVRRLSLSMDIDTCDGPAEAKTRLRSARINEWVSGSQSFYNQNYGFPADLHQFIERIAR